jgi:hypothetical protein
MLPSVAMRYGVAAVLHASAITLNLMRFQIVEQRRLIIRRATSPPRPSSSAPARVARGARPAPCYYVYAMRAPCKKKKTEADDA